MDLFSPVSLGDLQLANRVVMAPLTRLRSGDAGVPDELVAEHYAQRASLGLIITEGTFPNAESRAYPGQPGIVTDEQVEGWRRVAEAVHARGGRIVMQLMHGGRVSHPDINGPTGSWRRQRDRDPGRGPHAGAEAALPRAARADHRGARAPRGRVRAAPRARGRRRSGRRRDPQRERLPAARVPLARVQRAHRRVRRQRREPGPLRRRGGDRGRRGDRCRQGRHPHLARAQHPGRPRDRPRRRAAPPTARWSTGSARSGWPT